jgi:protein-S-isoprenylcysteine O-methyltransferase Ste14
MQNYFGALTILLLAAMVITRARQLKSQGIEAFNFGKIDRTDFIIPPFALFYSYLVFAAAFDLPTLSRQVFFNSPALAWLGVALCFAALLLFLFALIAFGNSFRVGIDQENPDQLITTGVFAWTRNPIYLAFFIVLFGQFLIFPNWLLLLYFLGALWLINRQVLREEQFLRQHYGDQFTEYAARVRRYL